MVEFLSVPSNLPKIVLILFGVVAIIFAEGRFGRRILSGRSAIWLVLIMYLGLRAGAFVGIYIIGPGAVMSSDLVVYYYPQVTQLASGLVPYLDFESHYGPLFLYEMAAFLPISESYASLAAVLFVFELCIFMCFGLALNRVDEPNSALILYYYAVNPCIIYYNTVACYNSSILACFWVLGVLLFCYGRKNTGWIVASMSVFAGKALGVLALPAWLLDKKFRSLDAFKAATPLLLIAIFCMAIGMDLLAPLRSESGFSTPSNLWFMASLFIEFSESDWLWVSGPVIFFAISVMLFLGAGVFFRKGEELDMAKLIAAILVLNLLFILFSKKSLPHYSAMYVLFACYVVASTKQRSVVSVVALFAVSSISLFTMPIWDALGRPTFFWEIKDSVGSSAELFYLLLATEMLFIASHLWLLGVSLKRVFLKG